MTTTINNMESQQQQQDSSTSGQQKGVCVCPKHYLHENEAIHYSISLPFNEILKQATILLQILNKAVLIMVNMMKKVVGAGNTIPRICTSTRSVVHSFYIYIPSTKDISHEISFIIYSG